MKKVQNINSKTTNIITPTSSSDVSMFVKWASEKPERMELFGKEVITKGDMSKWMSTTDGVNSLVMLYLQGEEPKGFIKIEKVDTEVYEWQVYLEPEVVDINVGLTIMHKAIERIEGLGAKFLSSKCKNSRDIINMLHSQLGFRFIREVDSIKNLILPLYHSIDTVEKLEEVYA